MTDGASVTVPPQVIIPRVVDLTALRALDSDVQVNGEPLLLISTGTIYQWAAASLVADNGTTVVRPTDRTSLQAGRWLSVVIDVATAVAAVAQTEADVVSTHADVVLTHADVVLTHADVVLTHADVVSTHADAATASGAASSASASSTSAALSSATSGAYPNSAASNVPRGLTQASVGAITAGSGGTNGTFALAWSGGNFTFNPTGTFTVAGGVLTAVTITGPGQYIGSSPTVPTPSFAASSGLSGAAVALTAQFLVTSGNGYWANSSDGLELDRYANSSGTATATPTVGALPTVAGLALIKQPLNLLQRFYQPRMVAIGDSIIQFNEAAAVAPAGTIYKQARGELSWLFSLSPFESWEIWIDGSSVTAFNGSNQGISSQTTVQMLARFSGVTSLAPDIVFIRAGTNDLATWITTGNTTYQPSAIMARLATMCQTARTFASKVILCNIAPRDNVSYGSTVGGRVPNTEWNSINSMIAAYCADPTNHTIFCNISSTYDAGSGVPVTNSLLDGIHPSPMGALRAALGTLIPLFTSGGIIKPTLDTLPRTPDLIPNPTMSGTGGTAGSHVTGDVGTGWTIADTTGHATIVGSHDAAGLQTIVITPGGSATAVDYCTISVSVASALTVGKSYKSYADIEVSSYAWRRLWHQFVGYVEDMGGIPTSGGIDDLSAIPSGQRLRILSPQFECVSGIGRDNANINFYAMYDGTGGGTATVKIHRIGVTEVEDVRPFFGH